VFKMITLDWQAVVLWCLKWRNNGGRPNGQDKRIPSEKDCRGTVDHAHAAVAGSGAGV